MVATKMTVTTPTNRRHDRLARLREARPSAVVRIVPGEVAGYDEDAIRRVIKHPRGMIAMREEGSTEWPLDAFTRRRLADGSIKLADDDPSLQGDDQSKRQERPRRRSEATE